MTALIWGIQNLHKAMTGTWIERIVLENALRSGNAPELFALRFDGGGLFLLLLGGFDSHRTARKDRQ